MKQQEYRVGVYCRLSRDDENVGESGSITNQKKIIRQYCDDHSLHIAAVYQDDGFTGMNYNRPDFQRMLGDIESGEINCVITKDLSRLGRDYIMTGYYTEVYFPEKSVRYLALGDGYDSLDADSAALDLTPFKLLFNDMYAKDISKKQRASKRMKILNGEPFAAFATYGYKKDADNGNRFIIDEDAAPVVRDIFDMYAGGMGRGKIIQTLRQNKVVTPAALLFQRGERYSKDMENPDNWFRWTIDIISRILKNETYIGSAVHYRTNKPTHKSKRRHSKPEEMIITKNAHEPIIDMDTWEKVQREMASHPVRTKKHDNIFLGLVKCADCGKSMNYSCKTYHRKKGDVLMPVLLCDTYKKCGKDVCASHHTNYNSFCQVVLQRINCVISGVKINEAQMIERLRKAKNLGADAAASSRTKKIAGKEKRLSEIEKIYLKLYEDRALEIISDSNFRLVGGKLQAEQEQLTAELADLKEQETVTEKTGEDIQSFIDTIRSMEQLQSLDADILKTLIERIEIHSTEADDDGESRQQIDVYYRFIGKIGL